MPALIGALIVALSLGGAAYVFRDDLGRWAATVSAPAPQAGPAEQATTPPTSPLPSLTEQHLPALAPAPGSQDAANPSAAPAPDANAGGQTETARIEPPPAEEPASPPPRPVTAETLADALPPKAAQADADLPAATVGSAYRAELPAFADPGGKGLRLAASGLPDGLTFSDLGDGKGAIEGVPQQAATASVRIVATNHNDRTARMAARLVVADKPAPPPQPVSKTQAPIPRAPAQTARQEAPASAQTAALPRPPAALQAPAASPPPPPAQAAALTPAPPAAPTSAPAPSATPTPAPAAAPPPPPPAQAAALTPATSAAPTPAPAPSATTSPPTAARVETPRREPPAAETAALSMGAAAPSIAAAPPAPAASPEEKAKAFIASFDGGECFLIEPLPGANKPHEYQAVGRAIEPFRRFDAAYKREVGVEAQLTVAPISAEQCPALDLVRLATPDGHEPPRLKLQSYEVGPRQPLSGVISGLEGRRSYLILVDNDGIAHRLETKVEPSGDSATFSVPLTADANSVGPIQMLLAIASDEPIAALDTLHSASVKGIAPRVVDEGRRASAALAADYFKFVN